MRHPRKCLFLKAFPTSFRGISTARSCTIRASQRPFAGVWMLISSGRAGATGGSISPGNLVLNMPPPNRIVTELRSAVSHLKQYNDKKGTSIIKPNSQKRFATATLPCHPLCRNVRSLRWWQSRRASHSPPPPPTGHQRPSYLIVMEISWWAETPSPRSKIFPL